MAQQTVTLNPGESKEIVFTFTPSEARRYTVQVDGLSGTVDVSGGGGEELPSDWYVIGIYAEPSVVVLGNEVSIKVTYEVPDVRPHIGKTYRAECTIDGETITTQVGPIVAFPKTVYFGYTPTSIGTYTATALGKSVSFEVKEEVVVAWYNPYGGLTLYETLDALADAIADDGSWKRDCVEYNCHHATYTGYCPYCSASYGSRVANTYGYEAPGDVHNAKVEVAYKIIQHIENSHPDHPLTIPRCCIEVIVPVVGTYRINFDREYHPSYINWLYFHSVSQGTTDFASSVGKHHIIITAPIGEMPFSPPDVPVSAFHFIEVKENHLPEYIVGWKDERRCQGYYCLPPVGYVQTYDYGPTIRRSLIRYDITEYIFDQDITLIKHGDKVVFNVETGQAEYIPWE